MKVTQNEAISIVYYRDLECRTRSTTTVEDECVDQTSQQPAVCNTNVANRCCKTWISQELWIVVTAVKRALDTRRLRWQKVNIRLCWLVLAGDRLIKRNSRGTLVEPLSSKENQRSLRYVNG